MVEKTKIFGAFAFLLVISLFFAHFVLAEEDNPPILDKVIQEFLEDMESNPQDYYLLYNRTEEEINYLESYLSDFINYFGIDVSSKFLDDGRNFVLIEVPSTKAGEMFAMERKNSYIELYQEAFLDNQSYEYYLSNNWSTFDYLVVFAKVQTFYSPYSTEAEMLSSQEEFERAYMNADGNLTAEEMVLYYMKILTDRVRDYEDNPIDTDYIQLDKNQVVDLPFGEREMSCSGFEENYIFNKKTYVFDDWEIAKNTTYEDYCLDSSTLQEMQCSNDFVSYDSVSCEFGCSNGACVVEGQEEQLGFLRGWVKGIYFWKQISRSVIQWMIDRISPGVI